jgi:hypothetical protein
MAPVSCAGPAVVLVVVVVIFSNSIKCVQTLYMYVTGFYILTLFLEPCFSPLRYARFRVAHKTLTKTGSQGNANGELLFPSKALRFSRGLLGS